VRSETIAEAMAGVQTCSQTAPGYDVNERTMITADR